MRETAKQATYRRAALVLAKLRARDAHRVLGIVQKRLGVEDYMIVLRAMANAAADRRVELKTLNAALRRPRLEEMRDLLISMLCRLESSSSHREPLLRQLRNVEKGIRRLNKKRPNGKP